LLSSVTEARLGVAADRCLVEVCALSMAQLLRAMGGKPMRSTSHVHGDHGTRRLKNETEFALNADAGGDHLSLAVNRMWLLCPLGP